MRVPRAWLLATSCVMAWGVVSLAQDREFAAIGRIERPADLVHAQGTRLYVVAESTLNIFDTANAASPRHLGVHTFPEHVRAVAASGSMVYAATDFYGLRILDAADAKAPVERGSLPLQGGILTITTAGPGLVVTTNLSEGVQIVDVSNPAAPALLTSYFPDGYPQDVAATGRLLFLTDASTGLHLIDLTTPKSPEVIGTLPTTLKRLGSSETPAMPSPAVAIIAPTAASPLNTAVVLNKVTGLIEVYDVTDPRKAGKVGTIQMPGRSQCFTAQGPTAYVCAGDGVHLVGVSQPSSPSRAGMFKTAQAPQHLAVGNAHVFVALGRGGVAIFRQPL